MVDVSHKAETAREAVAAGQVRMAPETLRLAQTGAGKKGAPPTSSRCATPWP